MEWETARMVDGQQLILVRILSWDIRIFVVLAAFAGFGRVLTLKCNLHVSAAVLSFVHQTPTVQTSHLAGVHLHSSNASKKLNRLNLALEVCRDT